MIVPISSTMSLQRYEYKPYSPKRINDISYNVVVWIISLFVWLGIKLSAISPPVDKQFEKLILWGFEKSLSTVVGNYGLLYKPTILVVAL